MNIIQDIIKPPQVYVLPVDESASAQASFEWASKNTSQNSKFDIVHGELYSYRVPGTLIDTEADHQEQREKSQRLFQRYKEMCEREGRNCDFHTLEYTLGDANLGLQLCNYAHRIKANGVIMGSRGAGRLGRAVLGSVSHSVLQECECPVTVVKSTPR